MIRNLTPHEKWLIIQSLENDIFANDDIIKQAKIIQPENSLTVQIWRDKNKELKNLIKTIKE